MNNFAELLDRLAYEPGRNNKLRLIADYLRTTPDPERGFALAALTGALSFQHAKAGDDPRADRRAHRPGAVRAVLRLCRRSVGDGRADVAGRSGADGRTRAPSLSEVIETLATLGKAQLPAQLARWLDALDETGRWALLKLVTGGLRIGVSARLPRPPPPRSATRSRTRSRCIWPGLAPPYTELFAWLEGRADKPASRATRRRSARRCWRMPSRRPDFAALDPADFTAEWKWDGIRVQAVAGLDEDGDIVTRLYSRTGEDISKSFPDLAEALRLPGAIDGELLILRDGRVQSFNVLQQRLNRKTVTRETAGGISRASARLRSARRRRRGFARPALRRAPRAAARRSSKTLDDPRVDLSPLVPFDTWDAADRGARRPGHGRRRRRCRGGRRRHAQAPRFGLRAGPAEGPVVEMEARSADRRCGADVCAARPRQALVVLFGLHVRRLDARATRATSSCRSARPISASPTRSCTRSTASCATTPSSGSARCARYAHGRTRAGARSGVRGAAALDPAQVRRRHALSPHQPAALGQAAARGRPAGDAGEDAGAKRTRPGRRCRSRNGRRATKEIEHRARTRPRFGEIRMADNVISRFLGGSPLRGARPADSAVGSGRRRAVGDRPRSLEHPRRACSGCSVGSGTWASMRCAGCGAISCSARSSSSRSG